MNSEERREVKITEAREKQPWQPIIYAVLLVAGIYIGSRLSQSNYVEIPAFGIKSEANKINNIINYIDQRYVDSVDKAELIDKAVVSMLEDLDPHSYFIPKEELQALSEPLEGNFEGIGVEFMIQRDTLVVVSPIEGGPSQKAGIRPGDRIVKVDTSDIAGVGLSNSKVMKLLKGKKGTVVKLGIDRRSSDEILYFDITRDRIPIYSVVASFMIDSDLGYVKITRFGRETFEEFMQAMGELKSEGASQVVVDLRGNGGGFLIPATQMVDEFLEGGKMIVYTEGKSSPKESVLSSSRGNYKDFDVIVLIDQGSASASEIFTGALQDHDRSITIGRRSFGKGLVQNEIPLPDGSALRLTVARYYTPTGRSIQKPYGGNVDYASDLSERYLHGELLSADSIVFADSLKYFTPGGRTVYGGGGIMPDVFVPIDTLGASAYLTEMSYSGVIRQYSFDYYESHKSEFKNYTRDSFLSDYQVANSVVEELCTYAIGEGVEMDQEGKRESFEVIRLRIKTYIARNLFDEQMYYRLLLEDDIMFDKALEVSEKYDELSALPGLMEELK